MTTYIKPTTDLAFKKLFADQSKKEIVISFLNSILNRGKEDHIVDVIINDPANQPDTSDAKFSIVDVYCTDQRGRHFIIEMQVSRQRDYKKRSQYYVAKTLGRQLPKRGEYGELLDVFFVAVLNTNLFDHSDYLSYAYTNFPAHPEELFSLSHYYYIELSKFNKTLDQLETVTDKWIYFLKSAQELETIPESFKANKEQEDNHAFQEAFSTLNEATLSESERRAYEKIIDNQRVETSVIRTAREDERQAIALALLEQQVPLQTIALATGLAIEELHELEQSTNCTQITGSHD